jgi:hypothetical protein
MRSLPLAYRPFQGALLAALLAAAGCAPRTPVGQGLLIENPSDPRRPTYHDYGTADDGEELTHVFELRNTDPDPVTILRISPACVCTVGRVWCVDLEGKRTQGSFLGEPVITAPPGSLVSVEIRLDTRHVGAKNVDRLALVRLTCDSPNSPILTFELHTFVRTPLQITPPELDLQEVPQSAGGRGTVEIVTAQRGSPLRVLGLGARSPGLEVELDELARFDESLWVASVLLDPGLPLGPYQGWFDLRVSDYQGEGEGQPVRVEVRARVTPDVVLSPAPLAFSIFTPGEGAWSRSLLRALVPGERVRITGGSLSGEEAGKLSLEYSPSDPDAAGRSPIWTITLRAPDELAGRSFTGRLRLELDHPELPVVEAAYICRPR